MPLSIAFKVVNTAKVDHFLLVNALNASDIREIAEDYVINLRTLATLLINIRADIHPEKVGSVVFTFQANQKTYAVFSNNPDGSYASYKLTPGTYHLQATPYAESQGKGVPGTRTGINFTVVDQVSSGTPTARENAVDGEGKTSALSLSVSPNPVGDRLTIHFTEPVEGNVAPVRCPGSAVVL